MNENENLDSKNLPKRNKCFGTMSISHISVGTTREKFPEMIQFYDAIMKELGAKRQMMVAFKQPSTPDGESENADGNKLDPNSEYNDTVVAVAYGKYFPQYWVQLPHNDDNDLKKAEKEATAGNGVHIAFNCSSQKHMCTMLHCRMVVHVMVNQDQGLNILISIMVHFLLIHLVIS